MAGSPPEQDARELQLERLLRELLDEEPLPGDAPCPEALELRDMARRLRAATQWVPLPEGRQALRRALLLAAGHRPRRLSRRWGLAAAAAAVLVAWGLGGWTWSAPPSSRLYDLRLALEDVQVALLPTPLAKAEALVRATHARIAEIQAVATADDVGGLHRVTRALDAETEWLRDIVATLPVAERKRVDQTLEQL